MPVFPLVGSMMTVSFFKTPRFSASSIIAAPIRSFTEPSGLKNSHLSAIVVLGSTPSEAGMRLSFTSGVRPTVSMMLL